MRRFVPVPYDALAQCGNEKERSCVHALYERAHSFKWAPLRMTVREFAEPGVLRLESAVALLDALEADGLLVRERSTVRGRADQIRVFDPSVEQPVEHRTERQKEPPAAPKQAKAEQSAEHGTEHSRAIEEHAPVEPNPEPASNNNTPLPPDDGGHVGWVVDLADRTLDGLPREEAHVVVMRWLQPDQAEVARLAVKMRGDRRRGQNGRAALPPMHGVPEGLRRRDIAEGVAIAARRWLARQRDAPDPAAAVEQPAATT